jgi:hypothetical protein
MEDDIQEIRNTNTKGAVCSSFLLFARHGRALTGESPEHAQIVGSV